MESKNVPIENLGGNQEKKRGQELKYCLNITFSKIIPDEKQKLVVKSQDHLLNSHFWFVLNWLVLILCWFCLNCIAIRVNCGLVLIASRITQSLKSFGFSKPLLSAIY